MIEKRNKKYKKLIETAVKLFASKRYGEVTVDDIARKAKVAKGTVYLYFKDKKDIYFQALFYGLNRIFFLLENELKKESHPIRQIRKFIAITIDFFGKNKHLFRLFHSEEMKILVSTQKSWKSIGKRFTSILVNTIQNAISEGYLRAGNRHLISFILLGMIRSSIYIIHSKHCKDEKKLIKEATKKVINIFLSGLATSKTRRNFKL